MAMCARAIWRQDLDAGRAFLTTHPAANKLIMMTDEGLALCSPFSFAADFAAAKISPQGTGTIGDREETEEAGTGRFHGQVAESCTLVAGQEIFVALLAARTQR